MARVVVVGGGYGGVTVAKGLDPVADVILVEQKDEFVHHAAALRAAVDDVWEHTIFMPYSNLLQRGSVVHATVARVDGHTVTAYGHEPIEADYVVLATGSSYAFPAKQTSSRTAVAKARLEQLHENLAEAGRVLLVGGGTVGLEFAGEITNTHPDVAVTIVEKEGTILPDPSYTPEFRATLQSQLDDLGVRVLTGAELAFRPPTDVGQLGRFEASTRAGEKVEADMWFQCYGSRANTGYLEGSEYERLLHPDGTLRVRPTLQVRGHERVYAIGDITDVKESKRADAARQQARVVIHNISRQLEGEDADVAYEPTKQWVVLPLGPNGGASQLVDDQGGTKVIGPEETAEIKGTDLMVSMIRSQLGLP